MGEEEKINNGQEKKVFDFKVFLHKDFIKEGAAAESYLNKVMRMN